MKNAIISILHTISAIVLILAVAALILVVMGFRPFILESSSMEPLYMKGSLVWVRLNNDPASLSPGDVIAYHSGGNVILHRYTGNGKTAGDVTDHEQEVDLTPVNLVGKAAFSIPGLGAIVQSILSAGWVVWILIGILLILSCMPWDKVVKHRKEGVNS